MLQVRRAAGEEASRNNERAVVGLWDGQRKRDELFETGSLRHGQAQFIRAGEAQHRRNVERFDACEMRRQPIHKGRLDPDSEAKTERLLRTQEKVLVAGIDDVSGEGERKILPVFGHLQKHLAPRL
ncbi:hypothetical protein AURDEDRAFT_127901 [Auricularia subglabra TFB-10046 SS5]|nr:hypothetical protein AURDEDRAFT_127901 [Auricularia subglabra TFB-10046 SS5]